MGSDTVIVVQMGFDTVRLVRRELAPLHESSEKAVFYEPGREYSLKTKIASNVHCRVMTIHFCCFSHGFSVFHLQTSSCSA